MSALNLLPPKGLIEQTLPASGGLAGEIPARLCHRVLAYLESVRNPSGDGFPFFENPERSIANIETVCWAMQSFAHLRTGQPLRENRPLVISTLEAFHNPVMGIYESPETQLGPLATGIWRIHNDSVCRHSLQLLGVEPRPWPRGLDHLRRFPWAWQPGSSLEEWLQRAWVNGPRRGTKEVSQFLVIYCELMGFRHFDQFDETARRVVGFLEEARDLETGFISMGPEIALGWGMRGHRNLVLAVHWRYGIPEPGLAKLIDSTLASQREDGLFHDGSMCANMDAIHLLAEYGLRTAHRREDAITSTRRCVQAMFRLLAVPCGGFRYELPECPDPEGSGYGTAKITNGTAFVLFTLRYWQVLDPEARAVLGDVMRELKIP